MANGAMVSLDVYRVPLAGLNLIEASAGTGKTWTIAGLYIRLVAETGVPVERILVVTYTKAATEELRDRIRRRLVDVRLALEQGGSDDEFCSRLIEGWGDHSAARERLLQAIRGFDQAAIFTIHGFCQRALADAALECGVPFESELLVDERDLLLELMEDFWRRELTAAAPLEAAALIDAFREPSSLAAAIRPYAGRSHLAVLAPQAMDWPEAKTRYAAAYEAARASWQHEREDISAQVLQADSLNGNKYRRASIPGWLAQLDMFLDGAEPVLPTFDKLAKFSARELAAGVKKGGSAPRHRFFELCDELVEAAMDLAAAQGAFISAFRLRALNFANVELITRKTERRVQSYEDLLTGLQNALSGSRGGFLSGALRARYGAALIDEFQDTDPIQYDIFDRIYGGSTLPVFLVGDPKQAIYSFRGADIFAYLKAQAAARERYTLDTNWRSTPTLVRAVNAVFGSAERPFLFDEIRFNAVHAPPRGAGLLQIDGKVGKPLHIWFLSRDEQSKPLGKGAAAERCAQATAAEIARLLSSGAQGRAQIGARGVSGGDVAVLVRSHTQGRMVYEQLARLGIASVQRAQDNVFHSREAGEVERVLLAVAEPARDALVRAALVTDMLGYCGEQLDAWNRGAEDWERQLEQFHGYRELWLEHGFIRMFRQLLADQQVASRLLRYPDGERRLTNVMHLAELVHAEARRLRSGIDGLLKWFADRRGADNRAGEETQLRLESDANLVKIVTIHGSKGLQYPIVFCPFLWDGGRTDQSGNAVVFHDPEQDFASCLDMGSTRIEVHRRLAAREELAENIRLAYVALTRAEHRCYLTWGAVNDGERSALGWLFHRTADQISLQPEEVAARVLHSDDQTLRDDLQRLGAQAADAIEIGDAPLGQGTPVPEPVTGGERLAARVFKHRLPADWRVSSFSALAGGGESEHPDYDRVPTADTAPEPEMNFFGFPRGSRAGQCLHSLLERVDFRNVARRSELESLAAGALREYRYDECWLPVLVDAVQRVAYTPLDESGTLTLQTIAPGVRVNEMEFYYPLGQITAKGLQRVLYQHGFPGDSVGGEEIDWLSFAPTHGFMKGFIDLVFEHQGRYYLADYKSNWLGDDPVAYVRGRLAAAMGQHGYFLQYLIYTVALHRYLARRMPGYTYESGFGGVYYLFLRGMDPTRGNGTGVFYDRPSPALVAALDRYLSTGGGGDAG